MRTVIFFFPLFFALLAFTGCVNNSDELANTLDPMSRSVKVSSTFKFDPNYIATALEGPYESADRYLMMSTGHYLVNDRFFIKCAVNNNSAYDYTFNSDLVRISLGNSSSKIAVSLKNSSFNTISSVSIPANKSITVYFELPNSFMSERIDINIPQMKPSLYHVTNIHFYYNGHEQDCALYNFLLSTHNEENRN